MEKLKANLFLIFVKPKSDPKEKQVIILDQDVHMCGYFWCIVYELIFMNHLSLSFLSWIWAIFLSFSVSFSLNTWTFLDPILSFYNMLS